MIITYRRTLRSGCMRHRLTFLKFMKPTPNRVCRGAEDPYYLTYHHSAAGTDFKMIIFSRIFCIPSIEQGLWKRLCFCRCCDRCFFSQFLFQDLWYMCVRVTSELLYEIFFWNQKQISRQKSMKNRRLSRWDLFIQAQFTKKVGLKQNFTSSFFCHGRLKSINLSLFYIGL